MALPFLNLNTLIERALQLISFHPLMTNPLVRNAAGQPVRVNRYRNFGGLDINSNGLTLSIYPYEYRGTSNETVESTNAGVVYRPYDIGGGGSGDSPGRDSMTINLVVELSTTAAEHITETKAVGNNQVEFVRSTREQLLRDYIMGVRDVLLTYPVSTVGGLVQNSTVKLLGFRTGEWVNDKGAGGQRFVLHKVALIWQLSGMALRNAIAFAPSGYVDDEGHLQRTWHYVGIRTRDCEPIWWDSANNFLMPSNGIPIPSTPSGKAVAWDLVDERLETPAGVALAGADLLDNSTTPPNLPWIRHDLLVAGYLLAPTRQLLLYDVTQSRLELCDGTQVTHIGGVAVHYDTGTGQVINTGTGQPFIDPTNFISVGASVVSIYEANGLVLREQFDF